MNPYSRFRLISNTATAALLAGTLCAAWPVGSALLVAALGSAGPVYQASVAGIAAALVLVSLMVSGWAFPVLFRLGTVRKMVLGKHYVEGTWLMAERGPSGSERLTVLHICPAGESFGLSGYCLNQESEIESNRMVEYSKLDGPVLTYAYRSLMPDGAGNQARGLSEVMFEMRRGIPKAFSGHGEPVGGRRFPVEGVKLTKGSERRRLRKLEQRAEVTEKYWGLFFGASADAAKDAAPALPRQDVRRPVIVTATRSEPAAAPFIDRRSQDSVPADDGPVITRRRASDWRNEDATPTADRIRARMMLGSEPAAAEGLEDEDLPLEAELDEDVADFDADEDMVLDEDAEEIGDEDEYEADADDGEDIDEEDEELDLEDEADLEEEEVFEAEEDEYEADAEDEEAAEEEGSEVPLTEEEPVRIRQRYARRR
ncbi:hypothetical protein [Hyphomonas sp.]|uniref:hypothetical protein n=1 Tax=Hyphomonas sp. TaxID=87 RepID=UPI0025B97FDE|nr:hypothetical protein [Hyphomonas sp.]